MRPVSATTLVVAALLTSPALAGAAMGSMPIDVALGRYLLVAGLCWVLLTAASEWLWSESAPSPSLAEAAIRDAPVPGSDHGDDAS